MERDRFDGADIMHIFRTQARSLDWDRLVARFDRFWPLLFSYLILFTFTYPGEHDTIPRRVYEELIARFQQQLDSPSDNERVCQGTLVSRAQYLLDIGQYGYQDARLIPRGNMTPEDVIYWTWAIEHVQ
jgi:hypothetical protein